MAPGAPERQLVLIAVEHRGAFPRQNLPDDRDVFLQARDRFAIGDAVPTLHHLRTGRAEAEDEAAARELREGHGGHGRHGGRSRRHLHDRGAHPYALGLREDPRGGRHRVRTVGFGCPDGVVAEGFRMAYAVHG